MLLPQFVLLLLLLEEPNDFSSCLGDAGSMVLFSEL